MDATGTDSTTTAPDPETKPEPETEPETEPVVSDHDPVWSDYDEVPEVAADAVPDPYWAEGQGSTALPTIYLPPSMPGRRPPWVKVSVWVLVAVFLTATFLGVCLTYGPGR